MRRALWWFCAFAVVPVPMCADVTYNVSLNTGPLIGDAAAPFSLAFQLSDGSGTGDGNNAAVISNFQFGGGNVSGSPAVIGSAFGDLSSQVILTDTSGVSFLSQTFNPGGRLDFQLTLTTNVDPGPTPDLFAFSILDSTLTPIPTTGGPFFDVLTAISIDSAMPSGSIFAGDTSRSPAGGGPSIDVSAPTVSVVPEPGLLILLVTALFVLLTAKGRTTR